MALGWVGIEGIADILDVSEGRVRQMIGQDGFPRPVVTLGPRNRVWSASSIRAYKRSRKEITTLSFAVVPKATEPLPRVLDEVVTAHQNWYPASVNIYVRAWQGDGFTIALLAGLESVPGLSGGIEYYITSLVHQLPLVLGGNVCWLQDSRLNDPGMTTNVVLAQPVPGEFENPTWAAVAYDDLVDVVGERVEMYPAGTLTDENLRRFKAAGGPIELAANDAAIAAHVEELQELQRSPLTPEQLEYAQDLVAQMLRWHDESGQRGGETTDPEWRREDVDVLWAVRRRSRSLTHDERALAEKYFRGRPVDDELAAATIDGLIAWLMQVDQYSDKPRPRAARVARSLAEGISFGVTDPMRRDKYRTLLEHDIDGRIVRMPAAAPAAQRYLDGRQFHPISPEDRQREHRILATALQEDEDRWVAFGRDLFGNHVASDSSGTIAVMWPGSAMPATPADQLHLDGRIDTIATVLVDGKPSHLLPRMYHPASWAIGYAGGSPGDLSVAIIRYLEASGLPYSDDAIRNFVFSSELPETRTVRISELLDDE